MHISIEHFPGERPSFNVNLHSKEGHPVFLTVKGCRIVEGSKGPFISWPATKNEKTGKWWNHCFASEGFSAAVIEAARKSTPAKDTRTLKEMRSPPPEDDSSVPF